MSGNLKAIIGAIITALVALAAALAQGSGHVSYQSIIAIVISFFYSLGVIWGVPNLPAPAGVRGLSAGVQTYLKAVYGAFLAALAAFATAYTQGHGHIGWPAVIVIAVGFFTNLGAVFGVPNLPSPLPPGNVGAPMTRPRR